MIRARYSMVAFGGAGPATSARSRGCSESAGSFSARRRRDLGARLSCRAAFFPVRAVVVSRSRGAELESGLTTLHRHGRRGRAALAEAESGRRRSSSFARRTSGSTGSCTS